MIIIINNDNNLLDKIKNYINDADIFVCDITPDYNIIQM